MNKYIKNGIEYIGIQRDLPTEANFFGEVNFYDTVEIDRCKGNLKSIVSATIDGEVKSFNIIDTIKGRGNDGTNLLGKKLIVDGEYTIKIQYLTDLAGKTVFATKFKYSKFGEITVLPEFNNIKIEDLSRRKRLKITPYIEDIFVDIAGTNQINLNTTVILNLEINV